MANKKGQAGWIFFVIIVLAILIIGAIIFWNTSYQHGTSKDVVQGYDKGILWYHAYLKNDHNTAYCFDDERFIPLLEKSQRENTEVIVSYEKYVIRGSLCSTSENYENVIITKIEEAIK